MNRMKNTSLLANTRASSLMKKIAVHGSATAILTLLFFIVPVTKFAVEAQTKFPNPIAAGSLSQFLDNLLTVVINIGAIVVVFYLILAGFKYVTARGDEKQISSAHKTLIWTVIGGMVVLGAKVLSSAIQGTINELR